MAFEKRFVKGNKSVSEAHLVTVEEIRVCRINIASLHRDHIGHKFRCWRHRVLEEIDDDAVEALAQRWIPTECLLMSYKDTFRGQKIHYGQRTYDLREELAKNADKLIIDELAAFKPRLFESLDLLLHNDFKGSGPDEEGRSRTLVNFVSTCEGNASLLTNRRVV